MSNKEAGPIAHQQLKDHVYKQLREEILEGQLAPGYALREVEIASRMGVSKTPVREAFVRLQKDHLVELIPYRGAVVSGYSLSDLRELYELRELLEGACARSAAQNASADDLADLTRVVVTSQEAAQSGDTTRLIELFDSFDAIIYQQSPNRRIRELIENMDGHLRRIGKLTVGIPGRLQASMNEHTEIHAAIVRRDPVEAERLMRAHVMSVMADQLADFEKNHGAAESAAS